jgi:hypothetical protein
VRLLFHAPGFALVLLFFPLFLSVSLLQPHPSAPTWPPSLAALDLSVNFFSFVDFFREVSSSSFRSGLSALLPYGFFPEIPERAYCSELPTNQLQEDG